MTDRIRTLTVTLDSDYLEEDADRIAHIICAIRSVEYVSLGEPVDGRNHEARQVVRRELNEKIFKFWKELE